MSSGQRSKFIYWNTLDYAPRIYLKNIEGSKQTFTSIINSLCIRTSKPPERRGMKFDFSGLARGLGMERRWFSRAVEIMSCQTWGYEGTRKCTNLRFRLGRDSQLANNFGPVVLQPRCTPFCTPSLIKILVNWISHNFTARQFPSH